MKTRICIANRGEIACRIIKTVRKLGMKSIALYSEIDKNSKHVKMADEAYFIGESAAKKSYLAIDNILKVLKETKIDALHPGYGFLSENSKFAQAVTDMDIMWVGPNATNMELMSKKDIAIQTAKKVEVKTLSGSDGFSLKQINDLVEKGEEIGFPILIKAVGGGGGIGMKLVNNKKELEEQALSTAKMAQSAFGDENIYLEKYIRRAKHIEIQVFGLENSVLHFYERECSIQRRFQKIIEETPAVNISRNKILEMAEDAVKIAKYINYQGAGTVEFIYDEQQKQHYFLEMNTRIQVEHPITEECTNTDLIELQIKHALKDSISLTQKDIQHKGHSIECRIYAENPKMNFLPSPGKITKFSFQENEFTRMDSGFNEGDEVSFYYDPIIAKIITKGKTREESILNMKNALENTQIDELKTNLDFLKKIIKLDDFYNGKIYTKFVEEHLEKLLN